MQNTKYLCGNIFNNKNVELKIHNTAGEINKILF